MPNDTRTLAKAVADSIVVWEDIAAKGAAIVFWKWSREWLEPVSQSLADISDLEVSESATRLRKNPGDGKAYADLQRDLCRLADRSPDAVRDLFSIAWRGECNSRLGYYAGNAYDPGTPELSLDDVRKIAAPPAATGTGEGASVLVVVPFRDSSDTGYRIRNIIACLQAIADQSVSRDHYDVTVVECDEKPRWKSLLEPLADNYLFAPHVGPFNRSWAINTGVRNSPGDHDVICMLDSDVFADRDFIERNMERFLRPGVQALLPYREMFCLDPQATGAALSDRLERRLAAPAEERLRGFLVRRPPGLCMWIRHTAFDRVAGMDERYEGWGGEDTDFALRLSVNAPLDRHDDRLIHLYHPSSSSLVDGKVVNAHIPLMTWPKDSEIGRIDRYADTVRNQEG
ncbi:galactosyltransferase-related protein [Streptomyces coacervatus]|nr:galactosyltransferase-related protein [Streptomyces coacervatus]MDF2272057.1 galactosyltransferase-related protein [Streptomyces coacervatus]